MEIRSMCAQDYDGVYALWLRIKGFAIRSIDDSENNITRFLERNPGMSHVALEDGKVVGAILCGHDGRVGCRYHVCVDPQYRKRGIGTALTAATSEALKREGINKVQLVAFSSNMTGNAFWKKLGWTMRRDINSYEMSLNDQNTISIVE